jgi:hypothetical protein
MNIPDKVNGLNNDEENKVNDKGKENGLNNEEKDKCDENKGENNENVDDEKGDKGINDKEEDSDVEESDENEKSDKGVNDKEEDSDVEESDENEKSDKGINDKEEDSDVEESNNEGDDNEGDDETTISTFIEQLSDSLKKWNNKIPKECAQEFSFIIRELCNYLLSNDPQCPICGISLCDLDLSKDKTVICHNCVF